MIRDLVTPALRRLDGFYRRERSHGMDRFSAAVTSLVMFCSDLPTVKDNKPC